jgi:hypothetical protein
MRWGVPKTARDWRLWRDGAGTTLEIEREEAHMPTHTKPTKRPAGGRFARPAPTTARRPAARPATSRRITVRRRPPQKTGMAKVMESLTGAAKKGAPSGKGGRGAGLAVLAGAAGLALKNRDKLQSMMRRGGSGTGDRTAHADAPATPVVVDERPAT